MNTEKVVIEPEDYQELGQKVLAYLFDQFPESLSVKDLLICIETLNVLSEYITIQLKTGGVSIASKRRETVKR